jgi:hypothetical protein
MPDWKHPYDPYNHYNTTDDFNRHGVKKITKEIMNHYFPYKDCFYCALQYDNPVKICFGSKVCKLRIKDSVMKTCVLTRGYKPGDDKSLCITLITGQMAWLFYNDVPIIFRAGNETGTVLHHLNENPYNNHYSNIGVVDKHEKLHGMLRSFSLAIDGIQEEINLLGGNKNIKGYVKKLSKVCDHFHKVQDSPRVPMIINVFDNFIKGNITQAEGEKTLRKLDASLGKHIKKYDMRKIKYNNKRILEFEEGLQGSPNAI